MNDNDLNKAFVETALVYMTAVAYEKAGFKDSANEFYRMIVKAHSGVLESLLKEDSTSCFHDDAE